MEEIGKMPRNEAERVSKYEVLLTLEELILEIKRLLKNHGEFFVIVPNDRLNDVFKNILIKLANTKIHKIEIIKSGIFLNVLFIPLTLMTKLE